MIFKETIIKGCFEIELEKRGDERGFFARLFCKNEFEQMNLENNFVQINNSLTLKKGTIRGMHLQKKPFEETKVVRCLKGSIFDVAVDFRKNSPTYLKYFSTNLTSENRKMLYVPKGCAHGFLSLEDNTEVFYLVSNYYNSDSEIGLNYKDPLLKIKWPIEIEHISEKDKMWDYIKIYE